MARPRRVAPFAAAAWRTPTVAHQRSTSVRPNPCSRKSIVAAAERLTDQLRAANRLGDRDLVRIYSAQLRDLADLRVAQLRDARS